MSSYLYQNHISYLSSLNDTSRMYFYSNNYNTFIHRSDMFLIEILLYIILFSEKNLVCYKNKQDFYYLSEIK